MTGAMVYGALATKAKAMYGKRLRFADFEKMAAMGSEADVLAYLRQQPGWHQAAARIQPAMRRRMFGPSQWPEMTLCCKRMRAVMNPCSRSPCADWFRFMKSMSIFAHGMSRLNCVLTCSSGFCSALNPRIHIFDGENVCIQVMTPAQLGAWFAAVSVL